MPTLANKPGEPIASTKTLPSQVVAITSSQENNELGLEPSIDQILDLQEHKQSICFLERIY